MAGYDFVRANSDNIKIGSGFYAAAIQGQAVISVHMQTYIDSNQVSNVSLLGLLHSGGGGMVACGFRGTSATNAGTLFGGGRSQVADSFQSTSDAAVTAATIPGENNCGYVIDVAGDAIKTYLNGTLQQNETGLSFGLSSFGSITEGGHVIGSNADPGAQYHDGLIQNLAIWGAELSADEFVSLDGGVSPKLIRPGSLVFFSRLDDSGLLDETGNATLTL